MRFKLDLSASALYDRLKPLAGWRITTTSTINRIKTTYGQHLYGIGSSRFRPVAFASNLHNEIESIRQRVTAATPPANPRAISTLLTWLRRNKYRIFPGLAGRVVEPVTFEKYLSNSNASVAVKQILAKTRADLESRGIRENSNISKDQIRKWTIRKAFVKVENLPYRNGSYCKDKSPRMIQGATPQFISLVGPWIASLQAQMKKSWDIDNFITFVSGVSQKQCADHLMSTDGNLCEDDVSQWDASVSRKLCEFEVEMCRRWFHAPKAVLDLMESNVNTRGYTMHGVKYNLPGGRKSGDPYTSLFNSFWNAVIHLKIIIDTNPGENIASLRHKLVMLVAGDDNAMNLAHGLIIPDFSIQMLLYGFKAEAIHRRNPWDLEFCSCRLYPVLGGWTFGPMPGRIFIKTAFYVNPPSNISHLSIVRGTMLGLMPACSFLPPLKLYMDHHLKKCGDVTPYFLRNHDFKMKFETCIETPATWAALHYKYGYTMNVHEQLDNFFRFSELQSQYRNPAFDFICQVDVAGPATVVLP